MYSYTRHHLSLLIFCATSLGVGQSQKVVEFTMFLWLAVAHDSEDDDVDDNDDALALGL